MEHEFNIKKERKTVKGFKDSHTRELARDVLKALEVCMYGK
jgi:hypothetical protein